MELVDGPKLECGLCNKNWCIKCKSEWHKGLNCDQYQHNLVQDRIRDRVKQQIKNIMIG